MNEQIGTIKKDDKVLLKDIHIYMDEVQSLHGHITTGYFRVSLTNQPASSINAITQMENPFQLVLSDTRSGLITIKEPDIAVIGSLGNSLTAYFEVIGELTRPRRKGDKENKVRQARRREGTSAGRSRKAL